MIKQSKVWFEGMIIALQFFTVIPIHQTIDLNIRNIRRAIQVYPIVGLFFGGCIIGIYWLADVWTPFSHLALTCLLFTLFIVVSGGIHLDGWIDTSDAYFSYRDRDKRLEIMKDSRVGAFGVMSLLFILGWRLLFMYEGLTAMSLSKLLLFASIPFLSRMAMAMLLVYSPLAKDEGLAAYFQRGCRKKDAIIFFIYIMIYLVIIGVINIKAFVCLLLLVICTGLFFFISYRFFKKNFGGITGDTLGASVEGAETFLWMILWLCRLFVMG
ncbi:adenosylcobinamide-GDP ribazoletransferase [Scopulibacillus cellulosilyticus]|uniref:Adenosylcobinamide-GDP ribazoletransferase n=1 Tax=Scopulibacillus cellulosilyticus TaxID=2665665 RepID=A0ABW2PR98_9BACL